MPQRLRFAILSMSVLVTVSACAESGRRSATVSWDSAGIRIVEHSPSALECGGPLWRLAERPRTTIGSADGPDGTRLHLVSDALRLSDGRIVVANAGSAELRYFRPDGSYLFAVGGAGGGPGEFAPAGWTPGLTVIGRVGGDTVRAYDRSRSRSSRFAPGGDYTGATRLSSAGGVGSTLRAVGWLQDGTLVGDVLDVASGGRMSEGPRIRRFEHSVVLYDDNGRLSRRIGSFPGDESYITIGALDAGGAFEVGVTQIPFLKRLVVAAGRDAIAVGSTDRFHLWLYGPDGRPRLLLRRNGPPAGVSRRDIAAWIEGKLAEVPPAQRQERRRRLEALPFPDTLPAFGSLLFDPRGWLWVEEYAVPGTTDLARWKVFDREGTCRGWVEVPAGLTLFEVGDDYVLGRRTDALDVEYVQLYELRASSRSGPAP